MRPPRPDPVEVDGYQGAFRALVDRGWLRSTKHRDLVRFTDLTGVKEPVKELIKKLLSRAKRAGIPLYCVTASSDVAIICHSRRGSYLEALEWEILGHMGSEISQQYGLDVRWLGLQFPQCWMGDGRETIRKSPPKPSLPAS